MTADVQIEIGVKAGEYHFSVRLLAEVMAELPGYAEENETYQNLLAEHNAEVARIVSRALEEARPTAEAAMREIIAATDVRDELLTSVFQQFVSAFVTNPDRIELWHRMVDFNNLGFVVFPGWWRFGGLPLPQFGTKHFVNASVARVFLPIRPGYEAQALNELFDAQSLAPPDVLKFNSMVTELTDAVKKEDVAGPLGEAWLESAPTNGAHVEVEFSAADGLDEVTAQQIKATVDRIEQEVAALKSENSLRQTITKLDKTSVKIGPRP